MPKVGFATASQVETGLNFGEGWGEVVEVEAVVHQFPASRDTGEQSAPGTMVRMMIQRTDADGKPSQDDPVEEFFGCGSIEKFHPGVAENAEDQDPEDKGTELGAAGNCLWSDGSKINKKSKWAMFNASLEAKGFKPQILDAGFLSDLVGLKAHFGSVALPKDADRTYKRDPKALVVTQISKFPYESKGASGGKGAAKAGKAAAPAPAHSNGKVSAPAAAAAQADTGTGAGDTDALATAIFAQMATNLAGQQLPRTKILGKLVGLLAKGIGDGPVSPKLHKPVQDLFKSEEWLMEKIGELDYGYAEEVITFPAS